MRLRHKKGSEAEIAESIWCLKPPVSIESPIHLELGTGKGRFIRTLAKQEPNINFIGVEKYATVLLKAIPRDEEIPNLKFICDDVNKLNEYFKPHTIDKIYLNFSDPWPKKRHQSRRLTHNSFLELYYNLLKENGTIEFKTDNLGLFEFTLEQISLSKFKIIAKTYDLHNDKILNEGNLMTEYEEKFSFKGNKINKLILTL